MRVLFVAYLVLISSGIVYCSAIGLLHL